MNLRITAAAEEELRAAAWYELRLPGLGLELVAEVDSALGRIRDNPERFATLETAAKEDNLRRLLLDRFPFAIIFAVDSAEVRVLAVAHTRRRPGYWKNRE